MVSSSVWRVRVRWRVSRRIIFGDEPTGNLDSKSSGEVLSILRAAVDEFNQTVVIVTHDPRAAAYADRVVFLADGKIVDELREPTADSVLDRMKRLDAPQAVVNVEAGA